MMEALLDIDVQVFLWVNTKATNVFFDWLLPVLRNKHVWLPVYIFLLTFVLFNYKGVKALSLILVIAGTMGLSDTMSSKVLKPTIKRDRPCNQPEIRSIMELRVGCGGGYSFTSSHATNHFALSGILFFLLGPSRRRWRWLLFVWAGMIAYSQIYVGVHFPLDILCGSLLGSVIAYIGYQLGRLATNGFEDWQLEF